MNDLIRRLSAGELPVVVGGPDPSAAELKQRLTDIGHVFVKFPGTVGGTDLGVRVDRDATDLSGADFAAETGRVHVEGTLTLDYVPVRCIADLDVATLSGTGRLVVLEEAHVA
ncbi:hypothetical protein [Micromonospora sp. LH3U1]|uniref:hypothetical protein n=1 Tax=Micromonospora sp. LH3U1 TaxID=3018339 RepID=UPI00234BC291|nr:hypothetical protein [Micromonospora sp. LH3U1]WCN79532.1 hypothetical protein PCA76_21250 [Micromonospora sp. LH3U1]